MLAPVLLVVLRFVQGLGRRRRVGRGGADGGRARRPAAARVPGELGAGRGAGRAAPRDRRVRRWPPLLPEDDFLAWGWRVPFLLGVVLTGVGLFLRLKVLESPLFAQALAGEAGRRPAAGGGAPPAPAERAAGDGCPGGRERVLLLLHRVRAELRRRSSSACRERTCSTACCSRRSRHLVATPLFGALSDRVGRRPVYLGGAVFLAAFAFPFFWMVGTRETAWVWLALVVGMVGHAAMYGPQAAFLSELFGTRVRYTGASLGLPARGPAVRRAGPAGRDGAAGVVRRRPVAGRRCTWWGWRR